MVNHRCEVVDDGHRDARVSGVNLRTVALQHVRDNNLQVGLSIESPAFEQRLVVMDALLVREKTRHNAVEGIAEIAQILVKGVMGDLSRFPAHCVGLRLDPNREVHHRLRRSHRLDLSNVPVPEKKQILVVRPWDLAHICQSDSA